MDEKMLKSYKKFILTKAKKKGIMAEKEIHVKISKHKTLYLLAFVIVEKSINKDFFRATIQNLWKLQGKVDFTEVGNNLFIVEFKEASDLKKILDGRPWSFDKNLFCLIKYIRKLIPQQVVFTKEPMWPQVHDLPLGMMNQTYRELFG